MFFPFHLFSLSLPYPGKDEVQNPGKSLAPQAHSVLAQMYFHGHIDRPETRPGHLRWISLPEFSFADSFPNQSSDRFNELQVVSIEIEKGRSLMGAVIN